MKHSLKIMIVAGEASGDRHAARLVQALRNALPDSDLEFFGSAGPKMRTAGVEPIVESDELSVVGVTEIARALPMFLDASKRLRRAASERDPDCVILVDFPDFNLKLAKSLKKLGLTVIYYISPQLWAWRKYRVRAINRYVDLMLTILPFEKDWYAAIGYDRVEYVGNPLTMEVKAKQSKAEFCKENTIDPDKPIVALLPGSRHKEIVRILPVLLETAAELAKTLDAVQFVIAVSSGRNRSDVDEIVRDRGQGVTIRIVEDSTYNALAAADAAIVTSGTATLETGIIGTPMVIVYKTSTLNYLLLKPLISVEHYGLINLIGGKKIVKEMIQDDFSPHAAAAEVLRLLEPEVNQNVRAELRATADRLGEGGASEKAAAAIVALLD